MYEAYKTSLQRFIDSDCALKTILNWLQFYQKRSSVSRGTMYKVGKILKINNLRRMEITSKIDVLSNNDFILRTIS